MINEHANALRTLGRTLPKEQMFILFDAANEIVKLEGKLITEVAAIQARADGHWVMVCEQMKRADDLYLKHEVTA